MPCSPRTASSRSCAALLLSAALASCHSAAPGAGRDLLAEFEGAELRSDSLDLPFLLEVDALERRAWREPDGTAKAPIVWNAEPSADIRLPLASATGCELRLRLRGHSGRRVPVTVTLNGRLLGTVEPRPAEAEYRLAVPAGAIVPGASVLTLAANSRRAKGKLFALSGLEMRPAKSAGPLVVPHREQDGLVLPAASSVAFFVQLEKNTELSAEVEAAGSEPTRARLSIATDSGRQELAEATVATGLRRIRARPAVVGDFTSVELANVGGAALRLIGLRLSTPAAEPAPADMGATLARRPNVVIFLTDTLRADHLGAYGHPRPTSPRFDAFAQEGIVFEDAWAQSPWTKPSVASIFTGLTPGSHGVVEFNRSVAQHDATLAEGFLAGGFRTAGFSGNPIVNARSRFDSGFTTWSNGENRLPSAPQLVADALAWIDSGSGPFFLYVHTFEPHWLYQPAEEHWAPFRPAGPRPAETMQAARTRSATSPEAREWVRSAYEGEIHQNDAAFGALVDGLQRRQLLDASLVVFTADHGDEIRDHGGVGHATTLYQELLRIPLAVRLPGALRAGTRDREVVQQIDVLPTLLRLAGLPPVPRVEGRDLSSRFLRGTPDASPPEIFGELRLLIPDKAAARLGPLKLIENDDLDHHSSVSGWSARAPRATTRFELFDLAADPGETRNLAAARPITARYLASRIQALRHRQVQRRGTDPADERELAPEEREELRALGYLQ